LGRVVGNPCGIDGEVTQPVTAKTVIIA